MIRAATTLNLLLSATALAFGTGASAQDLPEIEGEQQIGTRFLQEPESVEAGRARQMQKVVARCSFNRNKDEATELLAKSDFFQIDYDALDTDAEEVFEDFNIDDCIGRAMRQSEFKMYMQFPHRTMRNLLAEEAYLHYQRDPIAADAIGPDELGNRYRMARFYPPTAAIFSTGDCISRTAPETAHALLDSRPTSDDESEAFEQLLPVFGTCMKTGEKEVKLQISMVRQMVADAMWARMYYAPLVSGDESADEAQGAAE
jgi:hypothetical protein